MSDADRIRVSFAEETTFGVKPGGTYKDLRITGESLRQDTGTSTSAEIRDDRQTPDVIRTDVDAVGDINFELSHGTFDDFFAAVLQSSGFSSPVVFGPATTVDAAAGDNSFNDSGSGFAFAADQWIEVSGFVATANNGFFKIVSQTSAKIVVSGGTLSTEAAGASVTLTQGAQIVNGVDQKSFSIEKEYTDLSSVFELLVGLTIDQFNLSVTSDAIITGSFAFMGKSASSETATDSSSKTAAPTTEVMNAIDNVVAVLEGLANFNVTAFSIGLTNNLRTRQQVATLGAISIGAGKVEISGTLQAYFETSAILDKYLNFDNSSLVLILKDDAGNAYVIDFPAVKYTSGQRVAGGQNSDIIADLAWTAFRDAAEDVTIRIARF